VFLLKRLPLPTEICHNDCELLALLTQGDKEAFATLYRRHWKDLYDQVYKRLKNPQQAEDIVQDVFVSLWSRRCLAEINNLPAYLHSAVRFRVFNYVERELAPDAFFEPFEFMLSSGSSADDRLIEKEMIRLIQLFAKTLPEKRKKIFLMHISGNMNTREMADRLHIKQKTVQNQLGRALEGLKTRISGLGLLLIWLFIP
jgi:RNA polymerase sigma-70 factor (family 1)